MFCNRHTKRTYCGRCTYKMHLEPRREISIGDGKRGNIGKNCLQIRSVSQLCPTLCDPMNGSTPGLPVHHQLREFTEIHVYLVSDAIQLSHPLLSPSPLAPNPSQHQSFPMSQLFAWGGQSTGCTCKLFRLSYSSKSLLCVFWSRSDMNSVYHGQNRHLSPNWPEKAWTTSGSSHTLQHLMTKAELE